MAAQTAVGPPPPRPGTVAPALGVGLLGCGTVGSAVARALLDEPERIARAAGAGVELRRVAVRHPLKPRPVALPPGLVTTDAAEVVRAPDVDVVVEAIGGLEPAGELVRTALAGGKSVVTANKELIARRGPRLAEVAARAGAQLLYEAAACAAIPIVRCLRESLAATPLRRVDAIVNGTCNFVLSEMEHGRSFDDALREARRRGYAEADPSDDVTGRDAASKAVLLATVASGAPPSLGAVEGITGVTRAALDAAARRGEALRLVAEVDLTARPARAAVALRALPADHPLARVDGVDNGVLVETRDGARLFFSGPGAGGDATAIAIVGDLVRALEGARARVMNV